MANIEFSKLQDSSNPTERNKTLALAASASGGEPNLGDIPALGDMHLVDEKEAAAMLRKPVSYMQVSRHRGDGPPFIKLGRSIRYDVDDLIRWVKAQKRTSTSDQG